MNLNINLESTIYMYLKSDETDAYALGLELLDAEPSRALEIILYFRSRKEKANDILGVLRAFKTACIPLDKLIKPLRCLDVCGTGGDGAGTFNVSTATAFLLAACGVVVAKNGGPASTSKVGSRDVLEALGIPLANQASQINRYLEEFNLAFISAADFYPRFAALRSVRKAISGATICNLVAPLLNPANIIHRMVGVTSLDYQNEMGEALSRLGLKKALVVTGMDRVEDEITLTGRSSLMSVTDAGIAFSILHPRDFGFRNCMPSKIAGGNNPAENAGIIFNILSGKDKGPRRQVVLANAAAALVLLDKEADIKQGVAYARSVIDSGKAHALYLRMRRSGK